MKHIQKDPEPGSLTSYNERLGNRTPNWKSFNKSVKTEVYQALLKEQGYTCCYCGIPIVRKNCHIEHFRPKSKYKHLTFSYTNLIASCQGEDEQKPTKPVHCGHKKGGWFDEDLMISPLDPKCPDYFQYPGSGDIVATDNSDKQDAAETTIEKLALNINKLTKRRRKAIDAALQVVQGLDDAEIQTLVQAYQERDSQGKYTPFWAAIAYTFKNYF